jgi:phosphoribosyl-ATP pyrophosphohydrolase
MKKRKAKKKHKAKKRPKRMSFGEAYAHVSNIAMSTKFSHVTRLLGRGREQCVKKIIEERGETIIALLKGNKQEVRKESAQLAYYVIAFLLSCRVNLKDFEVELNKVIRKASKKLPRQRKSRH